MSASGKPAARRVFLAGASGVIGRRLVPLLLKSGWQVTGSTVAARDLSVITGMGAQAVLADVFDRDQLTEAVAASRPMLVIHQLTSLPPGLDPGKMAEATLRNARIRDVGTRNLIHAAREAGATRLIAQSIGFVYAQGSLPHVESDPLATEADGDLGIHARGAASLEHQVLQAALNGVVLRYGLLYGPGTGFERPAGTIAVHVDAAAYAAQLAAESMAEGIFNIADDNGTVATDRARSLLHWRADLRVPPAQL